ncbi:MAG: TIGR00374 family protein [Moraxellaceae bacterium]|nr:MAG: TIGR00374 family protein [Moraxellaceae bacterium]
MSLWLLILGLSLLNYVMRFIRWKIYINKLQPSVVIPFVTHLKIYLAGFALTTTPGKSGELVRSLYLVKLGIQYKNSVSAFFVERFIDLISMLLLSLLCGLIFTQYQTLTLAIAPGLLLLFVLLRTNSIWERIQGVDFRPRLVCVFVNKLAKILVSSSSLLGNKMLLVGGVIGVFAWGAEGLALYFISDALALDIDPLVAISIYSIAVLLGALTFIPGGLGGTEAVMGLMLMTMGASSSDALVATLVCRVATLWFAVFVGLIAMASLGRLPTSLLVEESTMRCARAEQ